jgi:hypothetical protein
MGNLVNKNYVLNLIFSSISSCLNALSITVLEDMIKPCLDTWNVQLRPEFETCLAKVLGEAIIQNVHWLIKNV